MDTIILVVIVGMTFYLSYWSLKDMKEEGEAHFSFRKNTKKISGARLIFQTIYIVLFLLGDRKVMLFALTGVGIYTIVLSMVFNGLVYKKDRNPVIIKDTFMLTGVIVFIVGLCHIISSVKAIMGI
jgi:hypothetical protein